jgi:hypothetical protein
MSAEAAPRKSRLNGLVIAAILGVIQVLIHLLTNGRYGMFRDEFYYIACSDHLAWGYVDHPPLSIALLAGSRAILGDGVHAIRMLPALAGGITVLLGALIAREFGGRRFAQMLTALCVFFSPLFLVVTGFYSMNAFDLLLWAGCFYLVIRLIRTKNTKLWLLIGLVLGLGMLNKISMAILGFGLVVGMVLTPQRRYFLNKNFWWGVFFALLIFLPNILWQMAHDWPTLEFINNAKQHKITDLGPLQFLLGQIIENHPIYFLIWITGLLWLLFGWEGRRFRLVGLIYVAAFVFLVVQKSKTYYLGPAYPALLAAGACAIEGFLHRRGWRWPKPIILCILLIGGVLTVPVALPVLPIDSVASYQASLGMKPPPQEEGFQLSALPQHFADRFGWENMTSTVASVYRNLGTGQQAEAVILTGNYGQAGAINYFGPRYGLPAAISGHNSYHLWGPGEVSGNIVISVGISPEFLKEMFADVSPADTVVSPLAMPWETNLTVHVSTGLKFPLEEVWFLIKNYV